MQFDVDCAIDIMNYIIDNQKLDLDSGKLTIFYCKHFYEDDKLKKYGNDTIFYALLKLIEGGYIEASKQDIQNKHRINYVKGLTIHGHEFCENMKSPTIAEKVKNGFKTIGQHSLNYAETVIKECMVASSREATKMIIQQNGIL